MAAYKQGQRQTGQRGGFLKKNLVLFFVTILVIGGFGAFTILETEKPVIAMDALPDFIGTNTPIEMTVSDGRSGIRSIHVRVKQGSQEKEIVSKEYPRKGYLGKIGPAEVKEKQMVDLKELGLKDGEAQIIFEVRDYSLWGLMQGNLTRIDKKITIDTKPPKINLLHATRYLKQGGAGIVIYESPEEIVNHGAQLNGNFFPGFPLKGKEHAYIAYIALPYDAPSIIDPKVIAEDRAGNKGFSGFSSTYKKAVQKHDRINISDAFLNAKIPEFEEHYPEMKGDQVEKYIYTNRVVRDINNKKIHDLCLSPLAERQWQGPFQRMPGSPRAGFADHRTYDYKNKLIDEQVHLGVDIASLEKSEVRATEAGKVIFADYNGIYGNMVVLDHGQGVFSLYSHLSQINSAVGSMVDTNTVIGLTGTTGMAGGDHLHYSVLVNGIFVTPVEWWDPHWIAVTIDEPISGIRSK